MGDPQVTQRRLMMQMMKMLNKKGSGAGDLPEGQDGSGCLAPSRDSRP